MESPYSFTTWIGKNGGCLVVLFKPKSHAFCTFQIDLIKVVEKLFKTITFFLNVTVVRRNCDSVGRSAQPTGVQTEQLCDQGGDGRRSGCHEAAVLSLTQNPGSRIC